MRPVCRVFLAANKLRVVVLEEDAEDGQHDDRKYRDDDAIDRSEPRASGASERRGWRRVEGSTHHDHACTALTTGFILATTAARVWNLVDEQRDTSGSLNAIDCRGHSRLGNCRWAYRTAASVGAGLGCSLTKTAHPWCLILKARRVRIPNFPRPRVWTLHRRFSRQHRGATARPRFSGSGPGICNRMNSVRSLPRAEAHCLCPLALNPRNCAPVRQQSRMSACLGEHRQ